MVMVILTAMLMMVMMLIIHACSNRKQGITCHLSSNIEGVNRVHRHRNMETKGWPRGAVACEEGLPLPPRAVAVLVRVAFSLARLLILVRGVRRANLVNLV